MSDLLVHIKAENAKSQEWMDAAEGRYAGMITEDLDHWASYDIHTVEQYERYMMLANISDLYKEIYGVRLRGVDFSEKSFDDLSSYYDGLLESLEAQNQEEEVYAEMERQAHEAAIKTCMASGAPDRETAERWLEGA